MGKTPLSDEHKLQIVTHYQQHKNMSKTAMHFAKKWDKPLDRIDVRGILTRARSDEDDVEDEIEEIENVESDTSRVNFVFTDDGKKRRLNELEEHEQREVIEYYRHNSLTKHQVVEHFADKWAHVTDGQVMRAIEQEDVELPVLLSNNSYSFTDAHKNELVNYYNQHHENITKFDFIRHFMTKWQMSEHPLERKIKDWLGAAPTFSTQFCTDTMRAELVEYFKSNDLSQDDVCKLFGQKWQRRPALLKKQLQRGLETKVSSGLNDDSLDDEEGDLPTLTSDSRYTFTEQHKREFIEFYNEKRDEMTKTAFLRHFSEKWHMSEHPLQRKMKLWLGKNPVFSAEFITDNMKRELVDYYNTNQETMSHEDVAKHFGVKWQRKPTLLKKQLQRSLVKQSSEETIDEDGNVSQSTVTDDNDELPLLTSDSKYVFNENHQAEFVAYYNENNDEITKTAFLRHFSEKWHMSEHPLLRRLEEWIGKHYTFSTEYCTAKMTREMLDYYLANRQEMTEDEVCQYFGKKWKRHRSRLKKCLLVAIEEHDRENGSGENMEMEFEDAAPPPVLSTDNQYIFTKQHQHEFIRAYHEKKNDMTKTAFIRHFASKWNMSEHPLQARLKNWLGDSAAFTTEYMTESMKTELMEYYTANRDTLTEDEICQMFAKKWKRHRSRLKKQLMTSLSESFDENNDSMDQLMLMDTTGPIGGGDDLTGLSALIDAPPPMLDSGSQYIFTKQHQHEFVKYYNGNKDEMTKTSFLRHFAKKWNMSEHPLQARLKLWIGKTAFSTEYLTETMRQELIQYHKDNHETMSDDEICQIFAKKWKRHSGRLKKYLPTSTGAVTPSSEAPPPVLSCDSQYVFTREHQNEFVSFYHENKEKMTRLEFYRHFMKKWNMSEHPLASRLQTWVGDNVQFATEFFTENRKAELIEFYTENKDTMTKKDICKRFATKWNGSVGRIERTLDQLNNVGGDGERDDNYELPFLSSSNQYSFTDNHREEFVDFYEKNRESMTKYGFYGHFRKKWLVTNGVLEKRLKVWIGDDFSFSSDLYTDQQKRQLADYWLENQDQTKKDIARLFAEKWGRSSYAVESLLHKIIRKEYDTKLDSPASLLMLNNLSELFSPVSSSPDPLALTGPPPNNLGENFGSISGLGSLIDMSSPVSPPTASLSSALVVPTPPKRTGGSLQKFLDLNEEDRAAVNEFYQSNRNSMTKTEFCNLYAAKYGTSETSIRRRLPIWIDGEISFASHNKKPAEQYTETQKQEIVAYFHEHEAFMTKKEVCEKFATQWGVDAIRLRRRLTDWIRAKRGANDAPLTVTPKTETVVSSGGGASVSTIKTEVDEDFDFSTAQKAEFLAHFLQNNDQGRKIFKTFELKWGVSAHIIRSKYANSNWLEHVSTEFNLAALAEPSAESEDGEENRRPDRLSLSMSTTTTPKRPVGRSGWNASLAEKLEIIDFYGRHKAKGMGYGLTARHFAQKWGYQNGLNAAAVRWCWMKREKIMKQVAGSSQSEMQIKRELDEVELDEELINWDVPTPVKEEPNPRLSEDTSTSSSPEQAQTTKKARKYSTEQKADFIRLYDSNRENMTMGQITKLFENRWSLSPIHRRVVSRWLANRDTILSNETLITEEENHHHHHHHHSTQLTDHISDELHLPHSQSSYGIGFVYDFETNEIMYL